MSKGQAGGEAAEGQDGCAEPLLLGPALAHRFALGDVKFSLVGVQRTLTIDPSRPVKLVPLPVEGAPTTERHFVALPGVPMSNTYPLGATINTVTIFCDGARGGAIRLALRGIAAVPSWTYNTVLFVHTAGDPGPIVADARLWVFLRVDANSPMRSLELTADGRNISVIPSNKAGPLVPSSVANGKVVAGWIAPTEYGVDYQVSYNGDAVTIPTEQNPDNFGPQLDFAAQVLASQ